jgi:hypothetical protein
VTRLAGDRSGGVRLAHDATHAYWTTAEGWLERGSLATGDVEPLVQLASSSAAIALSDTHVYAADAVQLRRIPKAGGEFESLAPGSFAPMDLAVADERVYLLDRGDIISGALFEWTPESGLAKRLDFLDFPRAVAVDATDVYLIANGALWEGDYVTGPLLRVPRDGGAAEVLASGLPEPFGVELDAETIYWGVGLDATWSLAPALFARRKAGGEIATLATLSDGLPVAFAIDDAFAYVTLPRFSNGDLTTSTLYRVPLAGGEPSALREEAASFFTEPAANATHVALTQQKAPNAPTKEIADVLVICKR